jgi:ESCRT-I complex subunit TSG101
MQLLAMWRLHWKSLALLSLREPFLISTVYTNGAIEELACLRGTIPVHFKGSQYNIPVNIFLSKDYPHHCPTCMVTPTPDMVIKPSQYIDAKGMVFLPYLHEWNHVS